MDRRSLLRRTGVAAGALAAGAAAPVLVEAASRGEGRGHDVPKSLLVDKVVHTTCSPNCTGSCGQLAFVRDGVIVKIQQAADYPDAAYEDRRRLGARVRARERHDALRRDARDRRGALRRPPLQLRPHEREAGRRVEGLAARESDRERAAEGGRRIQSLDHGDLNGRALALLAPLTGNVGRSGGGLSVYVGQYKVRVDTSPWWSPDGKKAKICPSIYFVRGRTETMHPDVPYPKNGWHGRFCSFANMFVQSMDVNRLHQTLAGLDLIVVVDHQRTETVRWADVVLPATTWYEKTDLTATPLRPYLQLQQAAIEPVGESRSELWIWRELMRRIAPELAAKYFEVSEDDAIRAILAAGGGAGGPTEGITLEQLRSGPVRRACPTRTSPSSGKVDGGGA